MYFTHVGSEAEVFETTRISNFLGQGYQRGLDMKEFRIKDIKNIASLQGVKYLSCNKRWNLHKHRERAAAEAHDFVWPKPILCFQCNDGTEMY